ncbi:hypothetical protein NSQ95_07315 [Psychrobacillus sp. FSL W7-1457]|uniref:hypothetical protein n=1 Tax=Psychrobacillus sp. FSL W7-1457 TaxID=2954547 RepID=UPI003159BFDD
MIEEKHHLNTKWYLSGDLKICQQDLGDGRIGIWVSIQKFNVCFTMIMYDFIEWCKVLDIDLEFNLIWKNHRGFVINSKDQVIVLSEIKRFIDINNIEPSEADEEFSDEMWYS